MATSSVAWCVNLYTQLQEQFGNRAFGMDEAEEAISTKGPGHKRLCLGILAEAGWLSYSQGTWRFKVNPGHLTVPISPDMRRKTRRLRKTIETVCRIFDVAGQEGRDDPGSL